MVNPSNSDHGVARVVHHKDYYIRTGDVSFLVENHLFRVHSYFFERESIFFRQMLTGATPAGERSGSPDGDAYTLDDVRSEDFARFLWVFYNPKYSLYQAPLENWLSVLHLANRWGFLSVKDLTVRELEKLTIEPIDKISIYHTYSIDKLFLIPSYIAVCKRDKPLGMAEGTKLGLETVLRLAEARERVRQRAVESGIRSPTFADVEEFEVEGLIREVFGIPSRPTSPIITGSPVKGSHSKNGSINGYSSFTASGNGFAFSAPPPANGSAAKLVEAVSAKLGANVEPTPPVAVNTAVSDVNTSDLANQRPSSPAPKSAVGRGGTPGEPSTAEQTGVEEAEATATVPDHSTINTHVSPSQSKDCNDNDVKKETEGETGKDKDNENDSDESKAKEAELINFMSDNENSKRGNGNDNQAGGKKGQNNGNNGGNKNKKNNKGSKQTPN